MKPKLKDSMIFRDVRFKTYHEPTVLSNGEEITWKGKNPKNTEIITILSDSGFYYAPIKSNTRRVLCSYCHKPETVSAKASQKSVQALVRKHHEKNQTCLLSIITTSGEIRKKLSPEEILVYWSEYRSKLISDPLSDASFKFRSNSYGTVYPLDVDKTFKPNSESLARAGFVYTPMESDEDKVFCVYCGCTLDHWEPEDVPLEEHKINTVGKCYFLEKMKTKEEVAKRKDAYFGILSADSEEEEESEEKEEVAEVYVDEIEVKVDNEINEDNEIYGNGNQIGEKIEDGYNVRNSEYESERDSSRESGTENKTGNNEEVIEINDYDNSKRIRNQNFMNTGLAESRGDNEVQVDMRSRNKKSNSKHDLPSNRTKKTDLQKEVDPNDAYWNKLPDMDLYNEFMGATQTKDSKSKSTNPDDVINSDSFSDVESRMEEVVSRKTNRNETKESSSNYRESSITSITKSRDSNGTSNQSSRPDSNLDPNSFVGISMNKSKLSSKENSRIATEESRPNSEEFTLESLDQDKKRILSGRTRAYKRSNAATSSNKRQGLGPISTSNSSEVESKHNSKKTSEFESDKSETASKNPLDELEESEVERSEELDSSETVDSSEELDPSFENTTIINMKKAKRSVKSNNPDQNSIEPERSLNDPSQVSKEAKSEASEEESAKRKSDEVIESEKPKKLKIIQKSHSPTPPLEFETSNYNIDEYGENNIEILEKNINPIDVSIRVVEEEVVKKTVTPVKLEEEANTQRGFSKSLKPKLFEMSFDDDIIGVKKKRRAGLLESVTLKKPKSNEKLEALSRKNLLSKSPIESPIEDALPADISVSTDVENIQIKSEVELDGSQDDQLHKLTRNESEYPNISESKQASEEEEEEGQDEEQEEEEEEEEEESPQKPTRRLLDFSSDDDSLDGELYSEYIKDIKEINKELSRSMEDSQDEFEPADEVNSPDETGSRRENNYETFSGIEQAIEPEHPEEKDEVDEVKNKESENRVESDVSYGVEVEREEDKGEEKLEEQIEEEAGEKIEVEFEEVAKENEVDVGVDAEEEAEVSEEEKREDNRKEMEREEAEAKEEQILYEYYKHDHHESTHQSASPNLKSPLFRADFLEEGVQDIRTDNVDKQNASETKEYQGEKNGDVEEHGSEDKSDVNARELARIIGQAFDEKSEDELRETENNSFVDAKPDLSDSALRLTSPDSSAPMAQYTRSSIASQKSGLEGISGLNASTPQKDYQNPPETRPKTTKWIPASTSPFLETLSNMEGTSSDLKELTRSQNDLHDDYDSELTNFISAMPENEEAMTIHEWIRHTAANSRSLVKEYAAEIIAFYEKEYKRALETLRGLPTE